ncbi:MAG TPA: ABC transporter substrate-binding protein [Actinomycetota bacterium]|nr:ABC transporter substrate-binding protein [Actinomycetota bacterium]
MRKGSSSVVCAVVLSWGLAACGSDAQPDPSPEASSTGVATFPVTLETVDGPVTLPERPSAIVSLSPTATEMLFAIGAGEQVVAVDDQSDFPAQAPVTDLSGFEPNIEAIAGYGPDLVVLSDDIGGVVKGLEKLEVPVLLQPAAATIEDTYAQMEQLGVATGHAGEAIVAVSDMAREVERILAETPDATGVSVYHELDDTYYSVTSDTFIGQVYSMFGVDNIADEAKGAGSGYPQLSSEYIVDRDPTLIVLADGECCGQSAATVAARPGWQELTAVTEGSVIEVDDDVASRWGPRVVEFMRAVADGLREVA